MSGRTTFDEMLHETYVRWSDTHNRLDALVEQMRSDPLMNPEYVRLQLRMLLDDVTKWRADAKQDYEDF